MKPHAPTKPSRAFQRSLRRLEREAEADFAEARRAAEAVGSGRCLVSAECLGMAEALDDPGIGPSVLKAMTAAYGAAHGVGTGLLAECMTCRGLWSTDRVPAAVLRVATTRPDTMGIGLVCRECSALDDATLKAAVGHAVRRDFLGGEGEEVTAAMIGPGGSA